MDLNFYRFDLSWEIPHPRGVVFDALVNLEAYPLWWPDYREVRPIGDGVVAIMLQSSLPYALRLTNKFLVKDENQGNFRLQMEGDIAGWIDFAMAEQGGAATLVRITQECTAEKKLLRLFAPVARRAFAHNHALTMRRGRAGLSALLASQRH